MKFHAQKLYRPQSGEPEASPNLQSVLTRPINWELIRQQLNQVFLITEPIGSALRLEGKPSGTELTDLD